jgi:hypothetical protein
MKKKTDKSIFERAHDVVFKRSEEGDRQYGPYEEGLERAAMIASCTTGKNLTAPDMYKCLVALKLSRESYNHKHDNCFDGLSYFGALDKYFDELEKSGLPIERGSKGEDINKRLGLKGEKNED